MTRLLTNPTGLTSGRLLARNALLNVIGEASPFLVAIVAVPLVIHAVGVDRYGVLTLVMITIGYFGLFDFGLGSAATKFIAAAAASSDHADVAGFFWTSLVLMFGFGVGGAIVVAALTPWLVDHVLKIAPMLRDESLHGFYLTALVLPFVISGASLNATLSAFQRFDLINAVRIPIGIIYYVGPLVVLPFSHSLGWLIAATALIRLISWAANFALCLHILPGLLHQFGPRRALIGRMMSFGGWVTISGVLLPIMEYADRFIIGAMLSVATVAYYAVPYQVTNKLRVIPGALAAVVFPALSGSWVTSPQRAAILFERATRYVILALFPPVLLIVTLAPEALTLWLGPSFAVQSASVMRWLALAVFVNSLGLTPFVLLPAAHRPDLAAKLNLAEIPGFLLLLWWMLTRYGVAGAAAAYFVRLCADTIVLFVMALRVSPGLAPGVIRIAIIACVAVLVLIAGSAPMSLATKGAFLTTTLGLYALLGWTVLLEPQEREFVWGSLRIARVGVAGSSE